MRDKMSDDQDIRDLEKYRFSYFKGFCGSRKESWGSIPEHPDIDRSGAFLHYMRRSPLRELSFPEPQDLNVNMMPFRIGSVLSLPKNLRCWFGIINSTLQHDKGKTGYLTIQESWVEPGQCQRRPGLHTDRHLNTEFDIETDFIHDGGGKLRKRIVAWNWGGREGGIYFASNVPSSTRVWNAYVEKPGLFGEIEHLRPYLGPGQLTEANRLYWMTDGTPHEALPVKERVYRQFIRIVGPDVHLWYADHSTPNPLCEPAAFVVTGNKFTKVSLFSLLLRMLAEDLRSFSD